MTVNTNVVRLYRACISIALLASVLLWTPGVFALRRARKVTGNAAISYYTREMCETQGLLPKWNSDDYQPETHFEKLFKSPLNIDLLASAHSGNETGFEQVTADWGCDFLPCYGTGETGSGCESIGFYGPGAKDPAGGGCPRGPVRVYEDLTCAIKLGLKSDPTAFSSFCEGNGDTKEGMFECLAFFANVLTETGAFAETEERDPRPYCWNREEGNTECCPSKDHQPCLPDSDSELSPGDYPSPNNLWLTNAAVDGKCCTYHGRGFLQVSYEPNYRSLSHDLLNDETVLWHYPYLLDSDGVMGWTAALWFWFNQHPAQVANGDAPLIVASPRDEIVNWASSGGGFPGAINVINGMECSGNAAGRKALNRVSYLFAIAHRMGALPPTYGSEPQLSYYPLPGTRDCESVAFCRSQFHNSRSVCSSFSSHIDCSRAPYIVNASTPMGFNRHTIKMTGVDGETPICQLGQGSSDTPKVWTAAQEDFKPIDRWWDMLDITTENVCNYTKHMYIPEGSSSYVEGDSKYCNEMSWKDFSWNVDDRGQGTEEPQKPCQTLSEYVSHPLPRDNWESGHMGNYKGGAYLGRVGPGLVMALNGHQGFGDPTDWLCYHFGATACHWNIGMGCAAPPKANIHSCRVFPPKIPESDIMKTYVLDPSPEREENLKPGEWPYDLRWALDYYHPDNCPPLSGKTVLEQVFPNGPMDMDYLFSVHYSQSDGFANARFDDDDPTVNENTIQKGRQGPGLVWSHMLCAFQLGFPTDPDFFQKSFGLRNSVDRASSIPSPLPEDDIKLAKLEFAALAANMIKETGAMGQAEEQDPRCYCNYQGGAANPCCPNEWGNNPPCATTTNSTHPNISPEEMKRGTTTAATCCSYHGRGFLQTSYEKNYGDLGAAMLADPSKGISAERGRQLLVNFPQSIDGFGITGWVATFAFWLMTHPCQYCEGRQSNSLDWNAPAYSPHIAIQHFDKPGEGLGMTFAIINGQECENAMKQETEEAQLGAQMRLSLFYNLAHRMEVVAPGETSVVPLPGTAECDRSPWCQGTFYERAKADNDYREHAGGCWVLTPQPVDANTELWTYCDGGGYVPGTSKYGAALDVFSFSLSKQDPDSCTLLHRFGCRQKKLPKTNKPSMQSTSALVPYTKKPKYSSDYTNPAFLKLRGLTPDVLCSFVENTDPSVSMPPNQDCHFWCTTPSGAASCSAMSTTTCRVAGTGLNFVTCANDFFKSLTQASTCKITVPSNVDPDHIVVTTTQRPKTVCEECSECKGADPLNDQHCAKCAGNPQMISEWPCGDPSLCVCSGHHVDPSGPTALCTESCNKCVATSGLDYENEHCANCAHGQNANNWPCNTNGYCKCTDGGSTPATTTKPATTTPAHKTSTTRFHTTSGSNTIPTLPPPTQAPSTTQKVLPTQTKTEAATTTSSTAATNQNDDDCEP